MNCRRNKLPAEINEDKARIACEWHEQCKADTKMRYALSLENAINLKLSCGPKAASEVARWWLEQSKPKPRLDSIAGEGSTSAQEQRRRDHWEGP